MQPTASPPSARRALMVWEQLVRRGIRDQRVLEVMGRVPREVFVPSSRSELAYEDQAVSIGHEQTISQPYMVALTLETLDLDEEHRVLEVGTGSGYMTALLCELVREVISLEIVPELARTAQERLRSLGYTNFRSIEGDGSKGWPDGAPYDRIAVAAASPGIPPSLEDQLAEGGILVLPVGDRSQQILQRVQRRFGELRREDLCPCVYVPLIGDEGWGGRADPGSSRSR